MAIMQSARRRVYGVRREARNDGVRTAAQALRYCVEVEPDPAGKQALLKAAAMLEEVHVW